MSPRRGAVAAAVVAVAGVLVCAAAGSAAERAPADFAGVQASFADIVRGPADPRSLAHSPGHGIGIARVWVRWSDVEVAPGRYDLTSLDSLVASAARGGLRLLPVLIYPPGFRSSGPPGSQGYPPARNEDMAVFAGLLAARYGPRGTFWHQNPTVPAIPIRSWQIWNEPNLWPWWSPAADAAAYVRLLDVVGSGIERCDPEAEIVAAGLPNSHAWLGPQVAEYLTAMYRAGAKGTFDTLAVHPYGSETWRVMAQVEEARGIAARYGDNAPLWITELGWGTAGPPVSITVSESRQAELLRSTALELHARRAELGIRGLVYYQWIDLNPLPSQSDAVWYHIGLLAADGRPKPALGAYSDAIRAMDLAAASPEPIGAPLPGCGPPPGGVLITSNGIDGTGAFAPGVDENGNPVVGAPGSPAGGCRATPRLPCHPDLARVVLRPERFRAARSGPPLHPRGACARRSRCALTGARLSFRATPATAELRFARGRGRRTRPVGASIRFGVPGGSTDVRLLGRLRGRRLAPGNYVVALQLVDSAGRRSKLVKRRFVIVK
jgi:hypothetical protein